MSSTSSVCNCDNFYSFGAPSNMQEPWFNYYQSIGNPLVYYAEVQPTYQRNQSRVRKGGPNFFVKAFRWYTQEHHPPYQDQGKIENTPDFSNFAKWLDEKYGQFVQEDQKFSQNTVTEYSPPQKPKKLLATMKSHFKKRGIVQCKKDMSKKSCNSCEFIMKPKQPSATASDYKRGNVKAVCSDTLGQKKSALKSSSMATSHIYDVDYEKSIEIVVTEGDTKERPQEIRSDTRTEILTIYENKPNTLNERKKLPPCDNNRDVECHCVKVSVTKVEAHTQYDIGTPEIGQQPHQEVKTPEINGPKTSTYSYSSTRPQYSAQGSVSCQCSSQNSSMSPCQPMGQVNTSATPRTPQKGPRVTNVSCQCSVQYIPPEKFNECTCTRSFQDAIRAIYLQTKAVQKEQDQKPISSEVPNVATAPVLIPLSTHSAPVTSTPVTVPVAPPLTHSHYVKTANSSCIHKCRVTQTVQTSDHDVCFDDEVAKYPIYMKIIRADKLMMN